jgi:phenylalanine-4-hydroxylase
MDIATQQAVHLPADHPGAHDAAYLARRAAIAEVGAAHRPGQPIRDVDYTPDEDAVWARVSRELAVLHREHACRAYLEGAEAVVLPTERVPQLREVDARTRALTGFAINPVPGLVPTREFYGALADRTFLATQYVRHHSVPHYTPEPDIVHEIIGHANALGSPMLADLYERAGRASRRAESPEALEFVSRVFWFTIEFGLVHEDGDLKALGAGILSSFGELDRYRAAEVRPWSLGAMGTTTYDITAYQPVLFAAPSTAAFVERLSLFFDAFDDDLAARLTAQETS